ncbi:MAG: phosphotransferase [Deltaproteobacteria bacterium]|jgi:aminoglycoside phosphotransferase (APT) family kinase protein|nr:phosphotransferase [Deltaproteobacteria bacterium]
MALIPKDASEIDADWLDEILAERHPGVRVESVEIADRAEVTNSHAWLRVRYAEAAGAPESLFCKLLPIDPARRPAIAHTRMGLREAKFYADLAPKLSLRVPIAHGVRYEEEGEGAFVLLLEDLAESGCTVSTGPESPSPDATARALEDLAGLHVRFEDPMVRAKEAGWVPEPDPPTDYGTLRLQEGLDHHRDKLTDAFAEMALLYIAEQAALHALWREGPKTVIHGDAHIGNLFDDHGRTGFLDWGLVVVSTPLRDMSYFIAMSLSIEDRRAHERDLIEHYLDVRRGLGGSAIDFDTAWQAHRVHAAYLAPASCQIVTFPEDATERRKRFAAAFLSRASAAIEDLESRAALREVAGL